MKKNPLIMLTLALFALAALMLTAAPVPTANASGANGHHSNDPCYYTRHHYGDDADFQLWEEFCEDTVRELAHRQAATAAFCGRASGEAIYGLRRFCKRHCRQCRDESASRPCRIPQRAKSKARKGKLEVGKCVWDAQMDYDAIYDNARQQLEDAGYDCLVQKLYIAYRGVQRDLITNQRHANKYIDIALYSCTCRRP